MRWIWSVLGVKFIHCNNAGENKKPEEKCNADGLGIIFEYTATGTPQQNAKDMPHCTRNNIPFLRD